MLDLPPLPAQEIMTDFLLSGRNRLIFAEPGTGKTRCVINAADHMMGDGEVRSTLIVAPKRVSALTWPNELEKWSRWGCADLRTEEGIKAWKSGSAPYFTINYDRLQQFEEKFLKGKKSIPVNSLVLDECFAPGTRVMTDRGAVPIEDIKVGDKVLNAQGLKPIRNTFKNEVHSAVVVHAHDKKIISSPTHLFHTTRGWVEARSLKGCTLTTLRGGGDRRENVFGLWMHVHRVRSRRSEEKDVLQQELCGEKLPEGGLHNSSVPGLSGVPKDFPMQGHHSKKGAEILHCELRHEKEVQIDTHEPRATRQKCCDHEPHHERGNEAWRSKSQSQLGENGKKQPDEEGRDTHQSKSHTQGIGAQTASRGERETRTGTSNSAVPGSGGPVGDGVCGEYKKAERRVPELLQNRHCTPREKNCYRSGRRESQLSQNPSRRHEKNQILGECRVDRVEVWEPGNPQLERFRDENGVVYFYDLEVDGHPSYSVEGILVHNCHRMKDPMGKRSKVLNRNRFLFLRATGLTGTPTPNSPLDLFNQARLMDGGEALGSVWTRFRQSYATSDYLGYKWTMNPGASEAIYAKIQHMVLVMRAAEWMDIPHVEIQDIELSLTGQLREDYKTLQKDLILQLLNGEIVAQSAGVLVGKLRQFTSGAVYITGEETGREVRHLHDIKTEALRKLHDSWERQPTLVFIQYDHERDRILKALPWATLFDESKIKDWDDGKIPMWIAHPASVSEGLNLQKSCCKVVWFSGTYSSSEFTQGNARVARTGQTRPTTICRLLMEDTIDEAVIEATRRKIAGQNTALETLRLLAQLEGLG